jgi:D-amino-acid oxidase
MGVYLPWLISEIRSMGGVLVSKCLQADDLSQPDHLLEAYQSSQVVNCSGLGACTLAGDADVFPVRGAWYSFPNDGSLFPVIEEAHCSSLVAGDERDNFLFVLPRGSDQLVVGGVANAHVSDMNLPADSAMLEAMLQESGTWLPELRGLRPDDRSQLRVGLRPFRNGSVRLELDDCGILHNYGHGGSGVLLSWGCASSVHQLLRSRWASIPV